MTDKRFFHAANIIIYKIQKSPDNLSMPRPCPMRHSSHMGVLIVQFWSRLICSSRFHFELNIVISNLPYNQYALNVYRSFLMSIVNVGNTIIPQILMLLNLKLTHQFCVISKNFSISINFSVYFRPDFSVVFVRL